MSKPATKPVTAHTPTSSLFFFSSLTRRYPQRSMQKRHTYPKGMPARVMPSPGTDFRKSLDFRAVKPPLMPKAPHRQLASDMSVPSPQQIRSWSHTQYYFTRQSTNCLPSHPLTTALVIMMPITHRLLTNLDNWSMTTSSGRQQQNGLSNMSPAKAKPVKQSLLVEFDIEKQRSITFSGSCLSFTKKNRAESASSSERYFLPGLYLTPYSTISSFCMVRGSLRSTTFCSNVRGYAMALAPSGFLRRFSMSRLMMSVLMPNLHRLSNFIIIINHTMALAFIVLLSLLAAAMQDDSFLRFWPNSPAIQPEVPRILFVTSWNAQGRRAAIHHAKKFQAIILCLYDLRFEDKAFKLEKLTDIESSFMRDLKAANPSIKVYLRIFVVSSARSLFEYVSSSTKKIAQVAAGIVRLVRREKAHGIYYDSPFNLPTTTASGGPYDKFAVLLNGYIANKVKELLWESEELIYGVQVWSQQEEDIDFASLKQIKADSILVQALDTIQADQAIMRSFKFIEDMRATLESFSMHFIVAVPLFSWRNGIGMKTSTVKSYIEKNGVSFIGVRNGLCLYVEKAGGAEDFIPCEHYFHIIRQYADQMTAKLAFFEAGDAIEAQFDSI